MYSWKVLYKEANKNNHQTNVSPFINAGYVTCVIESTKDKMYNGSNIVTNSSLGMCAEKSAIASMISNQDYKIRKMVIVKKLEEILLLILQPMILIMNCILNILIFNIKKLCFIREKYQ